MNTLSRITKKVSSPNQALRARFIERPGQH